MSLHDLDYVVDQAIGPAFITRRTLMENLRPGRKYDYRKHKCARKIGNRWAFTDDDIRRLLDVMQAGEVQELDPPPSSVSHLPSGMSERSPRVRRSA
ncbi:hypothetical protein [Gordonia aichiensis]